MSDAAPTLDQSDLIESDILGYLEQHERKQILRLLTCGSVDDGKSTLIGRLLHDSKMIFEDQLEAVKRDSTHSGTQEGEMDLALLVDGLQAEREQGITIDVAYRYFSTAKRKFIIADTPGHVQYTRNMVTGASTSDVAIILIDARNGIIEQTRRHSYIASLLGIKHIVVAINKMDAVDFRESVFRDIVHEYQQFSSSLRTKDIHFIPISALKGDNVVEQSAQMPWYGGSTLMYLLENIHIGSDRNLEDMRFPVQYVSRPNQDFRGYAGTLASGTVRPGDEVMALPSRKTSRVKDIVTFDGNPDIAFSPQAVTLTLEDEIDISRGDMIVPVDNVPAVQDMFEATLVWMSEEPLIPGHEYIIKHTSKKVTGWLTELRFRIDMDTMAENEAFTLKLNEIGRCVLRLSQPIVVESYRKNRNTGSFIVVDRLTNLTVGARMMLEHVDESGLQDNWDFEPDQSRLRSTPMSVAREEYTERLGQRPVTLLLTGVACAGKTTLANGLARRLFDLGYHAAVLDGQNLRYGVNKDLGFTTEERSENLRRASEIARLMNDSGIICICALTSPSEDTRMKARHLVGEADFLTVHLTAPDSVCRQRDTAGMYEKAERGEIPDFPGVSTPYVAPESADLTLDTSDLSIRDCVDRLTGLLAERRIIGLRTDT